MYQQHYFKLVRSKTVIENSRSKLSKFNFEKQWPIRFPDAGMLLRNYRSHSRLLELPSRLFYSHSLVASAAPQAVQAPAWSELTAPDPQDDTADACMDIATAPAKGYLETLLEELNKPQHGKQPSKQDDDLVDLAGSSNVGAVNGQQAVATKQEESAGRGHTAVDGLAGSPANEELSGAEASGEALMGLAKEYADSDEEGEIKEVEKAQVDEFEEQLPTNTLFYGVAGKQVDC